MEPGEPTAKPSEGEQSFFSREERILGDIAGGSGFTFKRGNEWAIDPETGEATYDPKFFEDKGYTTSQALFGAFHEIKSHLVETADLMDTSDGKKAYDRLKGRIKSKPWLHIWENCRTDLKGNQAILQFAPSVAGDVETVYREKLFPQVDLTDKPKHLQFAYAVLRGVMVPDEEVEVDPKVKEAIDKLRNVKGKDVISLATDPSLDPLLALKLSQRYIEPVIEDLFKEDLKDKKDQQKGKGKGKGQQGEPSDSPFANDYKEYEEKIHPEPMDDKTTDKKIKEFKDGQNEAKRQEEGYEREHGVSKKEIADYYSEYRFIEDSIEPLRQIFRKIVEQRKILKRRLSTLKEEGVMIDPGLVAQTYMDIKAGVENPKTMKEFEGTLIDENIPGKFSIRLVADQSSSMEGEKAVYQRRGAILVMEALKEFSDILDTERPALGAGLDVQTELRSFGVSEGTRLYKALSKELTEKQRVEYFKGLLETPGGTNDFDALSDIEKDIRERIRKDPTYEAELKSGKRREIVIVFSDGDSNNTAEAQKRAKILRDLGVKIVGLGMTSSARNILITYAPDGRICYDINDLPKTLGGMIKEFLGTLSITGNTEDLLAPVGA